MLNLDLSILVIAGLIWILMLVLDRIYYKPMAKIIGLREEKITDDENEIDRITHDIQQKTIDIETRIAQAQKQAYIIKEEIILLGEGTRQKMITQAREDSQSLMEQKMKELDQSITEAEEKLKEEISTLSRKIGEVFL